jgi:hypothetical protein
MPLKGIINAKIEEFMKDYSDLLKDPEFDDFQFFSIIQLLKEYSLEYEDILNGIVDGGDDFGIDAIYIFVDGHIINELKDIETYFTKKSKIKIEICQSKKEKGFSETAVLKIKDGLENIFDLEKPLLGNSEFKSRSTLLREIYKKWHTSDNENEFKLNIEYISLGKDEDINIKVIDKKNKTLDFLKYIGIPHCNFNFIDQKKLFELSKSEKYNKNLKIITKLDYDLEHNEDTEGYIAIVNGKEFYNFITDSDKIEERIFEDNVRDFQGDKKTIVSNIQKTIKSSSDRKLFWCMNNGITILTTKVKPSSRSLNLENYQIINGCQTAHSLFNSVSEDKTIEDFELVVRIIVTENDDIALKIIQATNSQIQIDSTAIKSQELIHKTIEDFFKSEQPKLYYERRNNFYRRRNYPFNKIINPKKLFQVTRSSILKLPSSSRSRPTKLFEEDYDKIFNDSFELFYYKFVTILYFKVLALIKQYKKDYDLEDIELDVINNGSLHILRILFAMIIGNDYSFKLNNKTSELYKNQAEKIKVVEGLTTDENDLFIEAKDILETAVKEFLKKKDESISNILKKDDFDENYLNKEMAKYFKAKESAK